MRELAPSTMAASTTWPLPERCASSSAATSPRASSMPPPPKSPIRLSGGTGACALAADGRERAGQRDVVDVVAGHLGVGPLLAPARHAAVDQLGVAGHADVGAQAEALHDAGTEALEDGVGAVDEAQRRLDAGRVLEVDRDRAAPPRQQVAGGVGGVAAADAVGPVDADDLRAHVGEHHAAERPRPDALQLHDADARQRSHGAPSLRCCVRGAFAVRSGGQDTTPRVRRPIAARPLAAISAMASSPRPSSSRSTKSLSSP